jgi:TrmH family RNA methyltransferase
MIQIRQLSKLHGVGRTRKCALLLERVELEVADAVAVKCSVNEAAADELVAYACDIARFLAEAPESDPGLAAAAGTCLESIKASAGIFLTLRAINDFRHFLMRISGQAPADWDLHDLRSPLKTFSGDMLPARNFLPGLRVYLEDIRSPFNVGTIIRTAEALGFEEVLLSAACADSRHPRAERSSMGAVNLVPWRRCTLSELPRLGPVFALELGGVSLDEFAFPEKGVLVLGSEELGVSSTALALAKGGRVSIPMRGIKASINVAIAFGIAAQAWISTR